MQTVSQRLGSFPDAEDIGARWLDCPGVTHSSEDRGVRRGSGLPLLTRHMNLVKSFMLSWLLQ